jgi:hypothetical protein
MTMRPVAHDASRDPLATSNRIRPQRRPFVFRVLGLGWSLRRVIRVAPEPPRPQAVGWSSSHPARTSSIATDRDEHDGPYQFKLWPPPLIPRDDSPPWYPGACGGGGSLSLIQSVTARKIVRRAIGNGSSPGISRVSLAQPRGALLGTRTES